MHTETIARCNYENKITLGQSLREKKKRSKWMLALYLLPEAVGLPIVARLLSRDEATRQPAELSPARE